MTLELEYKAALTEFKASADEEGKYEGYFAVKGNLDSGGDVAEDGLFKRTLLERRGRVKVFYAHDPDRLIGPTPEVLEEDQRGLFAAGHLTLDSFWGKEVWALMKDNALNEGSMGYVTVKADFSQEGDKLIRHLRDVDLYEISPVPLGMNALTSIRAVKAALAALERGEQKGEPTLELHLAQLATVAGANAELLHTELQKGQVLTGTAREQALGAVAALEDVLAALRERLVEPEAPKAGAIVPVLQWRLRAAELALALR